MLFVTIRLESLAVTPLDRCIDRRYSSRLFHTGGMHLNCHGRHSSRLSREAFTSRPLQTQEVFISAVHEESLVSIHHVVGARLMRASESPVALWLPLMVSTAVGNPREEKNKSVYRLFGCSYHTTRITYSDSSRPL